MYYVIKTCDNIELFDGQTFNNFDNAWNKLSELNEFDIERLLPWPVRIEK